MYILGDSNMKKTLTTLITILMIFALTSCSESGDILDNLVFEDVVLDGEVVAYEIVGHGKNLPKNIVLPTTFSTSAYGTKPVVKIGPSAFRSSNLKSIVIPESYIEIGEEAFINSTFLEKVTFEGNSELIKIGNNAFKLNSSLKEITIPRSVKTIGEFAFSEAISLYSVVFEENSSLETIGSNAFSITTNLKEITLPAKVKTIDTPIFFGSTKLQNIYVDSKNTHFSSVDGVLYNYDKTTLIYYPEGKKEETYNLLESVIKIENNAFYLNKNLKEIKLNNNLKIISRLAFGRIENIKTLVIPMSVNIIEKDAFKEAKDLVLFLEHLEPKEGFHNDWNSSSLITYYKPNWKYSNDKPVLINK